MAHCYMEAIVMTYDTKWRMKKFALKCHFENRIGQVVDTAGMIVRRLNVTISAMIVQ